MKYSLSYFNRRFAAATSSKFKKTRISFWFYSFVHSAVGDIYDNIDIYLSKKDMEKETFNIEEKGKFLKKEKKVETEHWANQLEFILSMVGCCVGLGNLWRFPYLCNRNGGGAFLIPFIIFICVCGIPLFFLELSIGQFTGRGISNAWSVCPLFKGVGYGMIASCAITCSSYIMVIAWTLYFIFKSFSSTLPWTTCNNWWNTEFCTEISAGNRTIPHTVNILNGTNNLTYYETYINDVKAWSNLTVSHTSAEEFWQYSTLRITPGIEYLGKIEWHLVICLLLSWILIFLCLIRGVKSVGKVVYVTATLPYILLIIILIRGVTLPGAVNGIVFYLKPDFSKLLQLQVWMEAAMQVFYSLGACWGVVIALSCYNKFNNNCLRDAIMVSCIGEGTSFFGGLVIYSVLGFMANEIGVSVSDVVSSGPGLAFVAYPHALSLLPLPQLWCFVFFLMILSVGLDSQFCFMEVFITYFIESLPTFLSKRRVLCTFFACFIFFLLGLPLCTQGGVYIYQISDWYVGAFGLFCFGIIECLTFGWIYGTERFGSDIEMMIGRRPPRIFNIFWKFITPITLALIMVFSFIVYKPPSYGSYHYPQYAEIIGWVIAVAPFLPTPIFAVIVLIKSKGSFSERLRKSLRPTPQWRPQKDNSDYSEDSVDNVPLS